MKAQLPRDPRMTLRWYAIYCKSRHERVARDRLVEKGVTVYLAEYETKSLWGTRWRRVRRNLLPGYLLVRAQVDWKTYLEILQTQSVVKFVGRPWPELSWIPDEQVESLQLLLGSKQPFEEVPFLAEGQQVEVRGGPLQGLRGRVLRATNQKNRVIVSIDLLKKSAALEIDGRFLRPLQAWRTEKIGSPTASAVAVDSVSVL